MKIIDKTPYIDEKGQLGFIQRVRATMDFGLNWFPEIEAQKLVISQLDVVLEKGYTLIRNLTLTNSQIVEPIILLGPPGIYVIKVTALGGFYEAKGDQWNINQGGHPVAAPINLLSVTSRLARALQVFLDRQGVSLPGVVEPVLIATNPAMHIESLRPSVRVVMSDGVKQFASSLMQSRPLFKSEVVFDISERIITPRPKSATPPPPTETEGMVPTGMPPGETSGSSRAKAIFHAREESKPFDPNDLSFAYDENAKNDMPDDLKEKSPSQRLGPAPKSSVSPRQLILLAVMLVVECCILGGFGYFIFSHR